MDARDKEAIVNITLQLVAGKIRKGELDPNCSDEELKKVSRECAAIARSAYFSALEFLSG